MKLLFMLVQSGLASVKPLLNVMNERLVIVIFASIQFLFLHEGQLNLLPCFVSLLNSS
jgi:hypothetical protein